jgi:hypothetical protein
MQGVTAPQASPAQPRQPATAGPRQYHSSSTPLYDSLVSEYRLALRSVPGDPGNDDRFPASLLPQEYGFVPMARRGSNETPRPGSRHRGTSSDTIPSY